MSPKNFENYWHLKDFYYDLPRDLIAQRPLDDRESSRLMVLNRLTGEIEHKQFLDIINYLNPGDCLVLNDTKVIPARLFGITEINNSPVEVLLVTKLQKDTWEVMVRPGARVKVGTTIIFGNRDLMGEIKDILPNGHRIITFDHDFSSFDEVLQTLGHIPVPPYVKEILHDPTRYQTVYSKCPGSIASPTAGLHFTENTLNRIREKGVKVTTITLHVGLGTFKKVETFDITQHVMHEEAYHVNAEAANIINETRYNNGNVIAVGTTTVRTLEHIARNSRGIIRPQDGTTSIFIYPPHQFRIVNKMITNFHVPESTLLMLTCAFAGYKHVMNAYREAVNKRYRFYSFGDAMFIT